MFAQISHFMPEYSDSIMDFIKDEYECDSTERKMGAYDPLPSLEDYPGAYDFNIRLSQPQQGKSSSFYSKTLGQVFIDMNKSLLVHFEINTGGAGLFVRALPVYASPEFAAIPVNRCTVHAVESDPKGNAHSSGTCRCSEYDNVGHVMRTHSKDAEYCYDDVSGRHSVLVPVKKLQAGSQSFAIPYYFTCKTSCPRGMQRRPINVIFTLESAFGDVFGRKVLGVRICSCPKRDRERLERDFLKEVRLTEAQTTKEPIASGSRKRKSSTLEKLVGELKEVSNVLCSLKKRVLNWENYVDNL